MKVRTNEAHDFPERDATTLHFNVSATPTMDFAAQALHEAQARYFNQYPASKKYAHALLWDIEPQTDTRSMTDLVEERKSVRDPLAEPKRETIATVDNRELTTPVSDEVAEAISRVAETTTDALAIALAPFGLHPHDIAVPKYERVVYRDEIE